MTVVTELQEESLRQAGFYVPQYEIRIDGAGLPRDVLRDVIQLTYQDGIKEIDSFELTVNNWDPTSRSFKYVGSETADDLERDTADSRRYRLFEPCRQRLEVKMGYAGDLRVMLTGNFTTMEPNFPSGGAPTLSVRGLNILHQLRRKQNTRTWRNKTDSQIVQSMEADFPIPIVIDSNARQTEPLLEFLAQRSQYDIDFIFSRARARGYVVFIQEADPEVSGSSRRLYFGPSQSRSTPGLRDVTFKLEWGKSLIDFKPTLTLANQVKSVTVNGWSRSSRRTISATVDIDDPRLNRNQDLRELLGTCNAREEMVVDEPVFTRQEARERAIAILMDQQKEMVKATGSTIGLPDLRAGKKVRIAGLGSRFSGDYFLTKTTHTINDSGYITRFEARREDEGAGDSS